MRRRGLGGGQSRGRAARTFARVAALAATATLAALLHAARSGATPPPAAPPAPPPPPVVIESIEIAGNTRTPRETVLRFLALAPGDSVPADSIVAAVEALRASGLFESVAVASRRGTERGRVALRLEVREKGLELRLGAGYQDLSGWYLIPAEVRLDNRLGRGERLGAHVKLGYRTAGAALFIEEPRLVGGGARWGAALSASSTDRVYFVEGIEYRHQVRRAGLDVRVGGRASARWGWEVGAGLEGIDVDSVATAYSESEVRGVERGDELPREALPEGVAEAVGESRRTAFRGEVVWDSRGAARVAGSPAGGAWGRRRVEGFLARGGGFPVATADLRAYRRLGPAALAARARAGVAGANAPFHDRFHVGGLYTVRGFPSQSLSAPAGDTKFWSASLEVRAPLAGPTASPRLAGLLFVEAADGWDAGRPALDDIAAAAGFGWRLRVPWLGWLGLDVGIPITESPVNESFHAHGSIGWTY